MEIIFKTIAGLEKILVNEVKALGGENVEELVRAVSADGDDEFLYRCHLMLRTAIRILIPIRKFRANKPEILYHKIKKIHWADHMNLEDTFAVYCTAHSEFFTHSLFASLKVKDAIVDWWRLKHDDRPNVDTKHPTYTFDLHIQHDNCTLSLDASGRSLHQRGYRLKQGLAPISEVLAAGIIIESGWKPTQPFYNPMCGSGTFLAEAALMACNRSPHINLDFGFMRWKNFDSMKWDRVVRKAKEAEVSPELTIIGGDIDQAMVNISKVNLDIANVLHLVQLKKQDFFKSENEHENSIVIINPPYDERLQESDIEDMYKQIGDTLKTSYTDSTAYIITGNYKGAKKLGLRTSMKKPLWNGPIECRLLKFEIYAGSKKKK